MNWVGGNLSRHRRGKGWKEDMANQEQYFAKARSWQRGQANPNPVTLSAANFIPNYSATSSAAARVAGSSSHSSLPVPLHIFDGSKPSANLATPSQIIHDDAAERPLHVVSPTQTSGSAVFNNQTAKDHLVGISGPEPERRRFLKEDDLMQSELPKLSMVKSARQRGHSTAARQTIGQQRRRQSENPTDHREIQANVGGQRSSRKRTQSQIAGPPVDATIRIRVGSRSYQWSEAENSIRDPTYISSSPSRSADEIWRIASTPGNISYVIGESLTGFSSSTMSPSPWFSTGNSRSAHRCLLSDPTKHINSAASVKSQCPMIAYTDALSQYVRPPAMSAASSVSSMTVEVGTGQEFPNIGTDEEDIWRAWLNHDMPELQVPQKQQDITAADVARASSNTRAPGTGDCYAALPS
jgi:hypothetical protein